LLNLLGKQQLFFAGRRKILKTLLKKAPLLLEIPPKRWYFIEYDRSFFVSAVGDEIII